jgi:hypothetical protein
MWGKKKQPPRKRPSDEELRALSEHVSYEWGMLLGTAGKILLTPTEDMVEHNGRVESFLLHMRQIYEFFYRDEPSRDTDAVATDYVKEWSAHRPKASSTLEDLSRDVGRRAAHLTLHRVVGQQYPVRDVAIELLGLIRRFVELASPDLLVVRPASLDPPWAARSSRFVHATATTTTTQSPASGSILIRVDGPDAKRK